MHPSKTIVEIARTRQRKEWMAIAGQVGPTLRWWSQRLGRVLSASGSAKVMTSADYFPRKVCPYGPYATRINKAIFSYPIAKGVSVSTMSSMHSAKCHLRVLMSEPSRRHGDRKRGKNAPEWHSHMACFRFVSLAQPEMGSQTELFIQKIGFSCAGTHLKTLVDSTPWHRRKLWNVSYRKRCEWNMSSCSELCWFFVFFLAPTEATHANVFPSSLTLKNE